MGTAPTPKLRRWPLASFGAFVVLGSLGCSGLFGTREAAPFAGPHTASIVDVAVEGSLLATAGEDRQVAIWTLPELQGLRSIPLKDFGTAVAFEPGGGRLAVGARDEPVSVWDARTWTRVAELDHDGRALAWSADRLAVAHGTEVAIYDTDLGFVGELSAHGGPVVDLAFSSDGSLLATASVDRTARVWDVSTGTTRQVFAGHRAGVVSVAFGPGDTVLATGSQDKTARVWDLGTGEPLRQLSGHLDWVVGLGFAGGPELLVTADRTGRFRVRQTADGGERLREELGEGTAIEDAVLVGGQLLLAGDDLYVAELVEALQEPAPALGSPKVLDERCGRLLACGVALMGTSVGELPEHGLELVKMSREMDLEDPEVCLTTLATLTATLGETPPESCRP